MAGVPRSTSRGPGDWPASTVRSSSTLSARFGTLTSRTSCSSKRSIGNLAQAFGELLTLLESTKRSPADAPELLYSIDGAPFHLPENLYGTMSIPDRSLALVDLALRCRFAFETLAPELRGNSRIASLNETIAANRTLGPPFRMGCSFVTPDGVVAYPGSWWRAVVETEIGPLPEEYWFDERVAAGAYASVLLDRLRSDDAAAIDAGIRDADLLVALVGVRCAPRSDPHPRGSRRVPRGYRQPSWVFCSFRPMQASSETRSDDATRAPDRAYPPVRGPVLRTPPGTRTRNQLIKSQLLCQLS